MKRPGRIAVAVVAALLAASALGMVTAAVLAFATSVTVVDPSDKARVLAQTISEALNCIAMFPVFTLPVAVFLAWKGADAKTSTRVALAALAGLVAAFGATVGWTLMFGHAPPGANDAERARATASAFAQALYNGSLLALLTVPGAGALAWRTRTRAEPE